MKNEYKIGLVLLVLIAAYLGYASLRVGPVSLGQAPSGSPALVASTTGFSLTSGIVTRITSTSTCTSRVVTTGVNGVGLSFGRPSLADSVGHWQAASTTVVYDSGLYGCGSFEARANGATNLVVTETW